MNRVIITLAASVFALTGIACSDSGDNSDLDDSSICTAAQLEADFVVADNLPDGDPDAWGGLPPNAIVASTYLQVIENAETQQLFDELLQPIIAYFFQPDIGLLGLSLGQSSACNVSRTLTVWESEEAMMDFVMSDAHIAALGQVSVISRGATRTLSTTVSQLPQVDWTSAASAFATSDGPNY